MMPRKLRYLRVNDDPVSERDDLALDLPIEIENLEEWFEFCRKLDAQFPWDYELLTIDFNFKEDQSGPWFPFPGQTYEYNDFRNEPELSELRWSDRLFELGPNSGILIGAFLVAHAAYRDLPCGISFHTLYPNIVMKDMSSAMLATQILLASNAIPIRPDLKETLKAANRTIQESFKDPLDGLLVAVARFRNEFLRRAGASHDNDTRLVRLWMEPTSLLDLLHLFRSVKTEEELDKGLESHGIEFHERNGALVSLDVRSMFIDRLFRLASWGVPEILPRLPLAEVKPAGEGQTQAGIVWQFVEALVTRTPSNIGPVLDFFRESAAGRETRSVNEVIKRKTHRLIALIFAWLDLYAERWFETESRSWEYLEGSDSAPLVDLVRELLRQIDSTKNSGWKVDGVSFDPRVHFLSLTGPNSISTHLREESIPTSVLYGVLSYGEPRSRQVNQRTLNTLQQLLKIAVTWNCLEERTDDGTSRYRLKSLEIPYQRPMKTMQMDLAVRLGFNVEDGKDPSKQLARIVQDAPGFENVSVKDFLSSLEERPLPEHLKWLGWEFMDQFWGGKEGGRKLRIEAFPACLVDIETPSQETVASLQWGREIQRSYDALVRTQAVLMPPRVSFDVSDRLQIECYRRSAEQVGGDYYRVKLETSDSCRLYIGDVCGKGIPAGFTLQEIHGLITILEDRTPPLLPHEICTQLDSKLGERISSYGRVYNPTEPPDRWATVIFATIDLTNNCLTYCNAGHPSAILVRKDGSCEVLEAQSRGIGLIPGAKYFSTTKSIAPGDRLVFYTDGLVEQPNSEMIDCLLENRHSRATDLLDQLVSRLVGAELIADDITLLVASID